MQHAGVIGKVLGNFCILPGQKFNITKSKLLYASPNLTSWVGEKLSDKFGITLTNNLGIYLGTPLIHGRITKGTYGSVVDKVRKD